MAAGLPGLGISGLFYLFCALLMPVVEVWRRVTGRGPRRPWRSVLVPALLAGGTLLAIGGTGWLIDTLAGLVVPAVGAPEPPAAEAVTQVGATYGLPSLSAGLVTVALLAVVLASVQLLSYVRAFRARRARVQVSHRPSALATAQKSAGPIRHHAA